MKIKFTKMQGAGNDFILIDDRSCHFPEQDTTLIQRISARGTGIGCEGLILVRLADTFSGCDYRMVFFNPDGSRAEMCGNASRCVALFAYEHGIGGLHQKIDTDAGIITAEIKTYEEGVGRVVIQMVPLQDRRTDVAINLSGGRTVSCCHVNSGVPHAVVIVDDIASVDVAGDGRALRFADAFAPAGANIDFVQIVRKDGPSRIRTYERGVEAESGACGTGAVATAVALVEQAGLAFPIDLQVKSGDILTVDGTVAESGLCHDVTLTGPAQKVVEGFFQSRWFGVVL